MDDVRQNELGDLAGGTVVVSGIANSSGSMAGEKSDSTGFISTLLQEDIADPDQLRRKIIYTADMSLVVDDFDGVDGKVMQLIREAGGYRASVYIHSATGQSRSGTWVARIPTDRYDQFLYATGAPNRLVIENVLSLTEASEAGFRSGDEVLGYDGRRVFRYGELLHATAGGDLGEYVPVDLLRDGEIHSIQVRRGPLGVLLRAEVREPVEE